jgi:hypothetical protein
MWSNHVDENPMIAYCVSEEEFSVDKVKRYNNQ